MLLQAAQRIGIPLVLLIFGGIYFFDARAKGVQADMLIRPVFYLMALLFCINAASDLRSILREKGRAGGVAAGGDSLKKILLFALLTVLLVAILPFAGFVLSAMAFLYAALLLFKVDNKTLLYLMPVAVALALSLLFDQIFSVPLPKGFLGF